LLPAAGAAWSRHIPAAALETQIEVSVEQTHARDGRPVQNLGAESARRYQVLEASDRLEFRAPGATRVALSGGIMQPGLPGSFKGALSVDSSDPNTLAAWLQGAADDAPRGIPQSKAVAA